MKISLKITTNDHSQLVDLNENQVKTFGRSNSADIKLEDNSISGKHCQISLRDNKLEVTDLESKNGTFLNGIRIDQVQMFIGDELMIGKTIVTLEEKNMDKEASAIFDFASLEEIDDIEHLRLDFTGIRTKNQTLSRIKKSNSHSDLHEKEINLRKSVKSKIKLSKQEIRRRHKSVALFATIIDIIILLLIIIIPLTMTNYPALAEMRKWHRNLLLLVVEGLAISIYFKKNFKTSRFTLGEEIGGIRKLHSEQ